MADAWAWVHSGQIGGLFLTKSQADWCVERADGCVVPMRVETAKVRHANELHQTLKNLTGLAKMAASPLNTYQAAIRNADLLLEQIERESMEDSSNDKPNG